MEEEEYHGQSIITDFENFTSGFMHVYYRITGVFSAVQKIFYVLNYAEYIMLLCYNKDNYINKSVKISVAMGE